MLLPRHLADLYAAIFQTEVYSSRLEELFQQRRPNPSETNTLTENLDLEYQMVVTLLLPPWDQDVGATTATTNHHAQIAPVNPAMQAQSLQALLLQGTKAPLWLRQRVAAKLTSLAGRQLSAIIQVFVHAAPPKDKTAASLRLAKTLVAERRTIQNDSSGEKQDQSLLLFDRLCEQAIQVLDDVVNECHRADLTCGNKDHLALKQSLDIHTVWAILDQLPSKAMQGKMQSLLSTGLLQARNDNNTCIHQSVNRIATLLCTIPPSLDPRKLVEVFLLPLGDVNPGGLGIVKSTILGQLLRLSTLPPTTIKSNFRDDVVLSLRLVVQGIVESKFDCDSVEIAAMSLFYSVAPSKWDLSGYSYIIAKTDDANKSPDSAPGLGTVGFQQVQESPLSTTKDDDMLASVEQRVKVVLEDLIAPLIQMTSSATNEMDGKDASHPKGTMLPSVLFHLVLRAYFASIQVGSTAGVELPSAFRQATGTRASSSIDVFQIVAMCFLPLLCEGCPLEHLLASSNNDATGIFQMMQLVFKCAGAYFAPEEVFAPQVIQNAGDAEDEYSFHQSGEFFSEILNVAATKDANGKTHEKTANPMEIEILLSVTTLLLSLLIAIVELGSEAGRAPDEETALNSFASNLRPIAELSNVSMASSAQVTETLAPSMAELSEMAAHAMALLAARNAPSRPTVNALLKEPKTSKEKVENFFEQTDADLRSTQPPIRARGVVSLQRFLRGDLFQELLAEESKISPKSPLIVVLGEEPEAPSPQSASSYALTRVLECAISALADSESYVYLAAVQSIVAATDVCPRQVLPSIALAVAAGEFGAQIAKGPACNRTTLSSAQQIKLSEALIFCIRRRAILNEFVELLLDLMIFKGRVPDDDSAHSCSDYDKVMQIHNETKRYFLKASDENSQDEDLEEIAERQSVRFHTGGPVFRAEERDVVISSRVAVIAELVSATHPSILARYCGTLVRISTEILRLDASRPLRRAAALLALALYQSVLREQLVLFEMVSSAAVGGVGNGTDLAFSISLISSGGNDALETTLQRCLAVEDLHDLSNTKHRAFDAATVARCQEALIARQEAVDGGVFAVAKLIVEARLQQNSISAAKILTELLKAKEQDGNTVRALDNLRIDTDTLELS